MKTIFYAILSIIYVLTLLSSCRSDKSDVRGAASEHISKTYNIDGVTKVDSVIFINTSIPQLVLADESFNMTLKENAKGMEEVFLMMSFVSKDIRKDHKEELATMLTNSIKPLKDSYDSINKISTPKQSLALVQVSTTDTLRKKSISKYIYILGNSSESPISDSIIIDESIRMRAMLYGLSQLKEKDVNTTTEEFENIMIEKYKDPVLEFIAKPNITSEKW